MPDKRPSSVKIYQRCSQCHGAGEYDAPGDVGVIPCSACNYEGYREVFQIDDPVNVFGSYEILEELDPTEHNALTATKKNGILILLACGKVDLNDGKAGKVRLWNWFGAESTTVANLTALLT